MYGAYATNNIKLHKCDISGMNLLKRCLLLRYIANILTIMCGKLQQMRMISWLQWQAFPYRIIPNFRCRINFIDVKVQIQ